MKSLTVKSLLFSAVFITGTALANCGAGGLFDQNTGACYYPDGIEGPYSRQNGNSSDQTPQDYWGALAIDAVNGKTSGSSLGASTQKEAERRALIQCENPRDCHIAISYKNSCGAVATNGQGIRLGASDPNPTQAERKALAMCNKKSDVPCKLWIKARCAGIGY